MWSPGRAAGPLRRGRAFSSSSPSLNKKWDAVVIGGGHNGLTAVAYLARAGLSVAVLERRHLVGGAAVTEEIVPGFRFSRCSYLQSLLRPSVIRDLELPRHGLKLLRRNPSSFTPCLDGRYLLMGPDANLNHSEIAKFSEKDAVAFPRYEEQLKKFCAFMDYLLDSPTPEVRHDVSTLISQLKDRVQKSTFWGHIFYQTITLGQKAMLDFMDLLLSPASKVLNNWFETEVLKATLATGAVIGSMASVHTPGSGYVLLHHVMGETDGERGVWSGKRSAFGSDGKQGGAAAAAKAVSVARGAVADGYQYPWREKLAKYKDELSKGVWGYWELGAWKPLGLSARKRARLRKEVLLAEEDWPYDPARKEMRNKRKGHKCDRISAEKRAHTQELMKKMPDMLLDYKKRRWEKKMKEEEGKKKE